MEVLRVDDLRTQTRAHGNDELFEVEFSRLFCLVHHLFVAGKASLRLDLAPLRVAANPFELGGQALGELGVLLALDHQALALFLQVSRVVALVGIEVTAVNFGDPLGDVVEEVPVVSDGEDSTGILCEVLLEPENAFGVEVVSRLVKQEQVGLLQKQLGQRHAALLTTRQVGDGVVPGRGTQCAHRLLQLGVEVPRVGSVDSLLQHTHFFEE